MKITILLASVFALTVSTASLADEKSHSAMKDGKQMAMPHGSADMTQGEVTRISKGSKKITIKHGEIKNMDMPPMTMSFTVSDEKMLEMVKKGDKVQFTVEAKDGGMVITAIQPQ